MAERQGDAPVFDQSGLSVSQLNRVSKAAFRELEADGALIEEIHGNRVIQMPSRPVRFKARVYKTSGSGSGVTGSGYIRCEEQIRYSFVEQKPAECGQYETKPNGRVGDGDRIIAFEMNNGRVIDGTVQELEFHMRWRDTESYVTEWVTEYIFVAGYGSLSPPAASGSGDGASGSLTGNCVADGGLSPSDLLGCSSSGKAMIADGCIRVVNSESDETSLYLALFDPDTNEIIAGGPP